ncbi:TIM barrel protein [Microbacterium sp. BWT-B31]|uniref:sugar phosphate isomerase/epimerase family protein n=1 Tax=Microbacterium sp. BWT-B31 TaxID=3232072 RepID=UPI0035270FA3
MGDTEAPSATEWPIAACMHGIPAVGDDGRGFHDAPISTWDDAFAQIAGMGLSTLELADSHVRPADLGSERTAEIFDSAARHGVSFSSVHVQRKSVIEPGRGEANLEYAHRTIDAAARWGLKLVSTGLHQPLTPAQREALWFWSAQGAVDPEDPDMWNLAVRRIRDLGHHAAEVGLPLSLEMYEDTYLGTAESAVRFIEDVGLDNVGLNPDVGNLIRLHRPIEDWQEVYSATLPYANYWHVKNYTRDETADGQFISAVPSTLADGLINYRRVIRDAVAMGYRGIIVTEHYGGDSLGACETNARYIRSVLRGAIAGGDPHLVSTP